MYITIFCTLLTGLFCPGWPAGWMGRVERTAYVVRSTSMYSAVMKLDTFSAIAIATQITTVTTLDRLLSATTLCQHVKIPKRWSGSYRQTCTFAPLHFPVLIDVLLSNFIFETFVHLSSVTLHFRAISSLLRLAGNVCCTIDIQMHYKNSLVQAVTMFHIMSGTVTFDDSPFQSVSISLYLTHFHRIVTFWYFS